MAFDPELSEIAPEGCPDTTALPATVTVEDPLCNVGVILIELVETLEVYE